MMYPNSVNGGSGVARLSATVIPFRSPVPRRGPVGPQPRRTPGRPAPMRPRRPPAPAPRPAGPRLPAVYPRPVPGGSKPVLLPIPNGPAQRSLVPWGFMRGLVGGLGWVLVGYELYQWMSPREGGWLNPAGWSSFPGCPEAPQWTAAVIYTGGCLRNQAGVGPTPGDPPYVLQRAKTGRRRWGVGYYKTNPGSGRADHIHSFYRDYFPPHPAAAPSEVPPVADLPTWQNPRVAVLPSVNLGYAPGLVPDWMPVAPPFVVQPSAPPFGVPVPPNPGTPQWPDRKYDVPPDTVPFPGLEPYQPPVPVPPIRPNPEGGWDVQEGAYQHGDSRVVIYPNGATSARPAQHYARRPPRHMKERKARLGPVASYLWRSFGTPTEIGDTIEVVYKCLSKKTRREEFFRARRAPGAKRMLEVIYEHINEVDMGCVVNGFIAEQIEDFVFGASGRYEAKANRDNPFNRPLGYGAGFAL